MKNLTIFYRLSDKGNPKVRLDKVNNKNCLDNFLKEFPKNNIVVIADNVLDETFRWLEGYKFRELHRTSLGNSGSFWYAFSLAVKLDKCSYVYFVENDYIHKINALQVLLEGLRVSDYVTLYDHPDKYGDGENPLIKFGGEVSRVLLTKSSHWKVTNSTTMTFASRVSTLLKDKVYFKIFSVGVLNSTLPLLSKLSGSAVPRDFWLFSVISKVKRRVLISPIPGYSSHGEVEYLAPLQDWSALIDIN